MSAGRPARVALAVAALVATVAVGCGSPAQTGPEVAATSTPVLSSNGDSCTDPTGDLDVTTAVDARTLATLAGIDLTDASATVNGDNLDVSFTTAGPINLVPGASFVVAQGEPLQPLGFELRATDEPAGWTVLLITWPQNEKRTPLAITPTVEGNRLTYPVALSVLPPIARALQFGTTVTLPDGNVVIDDCSSLDQAVGSATTGG